MSWLHLVLFEPEIPGNTGNIIRLCANTGAQLHLVEPLGFELEDRKLRRAGLDYHEWASIRRHSNWAALLAAELCPAERIFLASRHAQQSPYQMRFQPGDMLVLGPETRGLPAAMLGAHPDPQCLRLPMCPNSRSLNLANAAAVMVYEAWRQCEFFGAMQ